MEINIESYLSEQEIKDIVKDELRAMIRGAGKDDLQRVIGNVSHDIVVCLVNEHFDEDLQSLLKEKVIKQINELSSFTVFKTPDAWERTPAAPYHLMQKVVDGNQHLIQARFEELVKDITLPEDFQFDCDYEIRQLLMGRLFGDNWHKEL
tara:strand:- start:14716 stop:15165 length:450 start_codon:yes stop_codon:yes gene_type:complete